jgi:hypothetical protein
MGGEELEEHERMWQAVDEEIRTIERTNESTDGPV